MASRSSVGKAFFGRRNWKPSDSLWYHALVVACIAVYTAFLGARVTELISLAMKSPFNAFLAGTGYVGFGSLYVLPPQTMAKFLRRMMLIAVVIVHCKMEFDYRFLNKYSLDTTLKAVLSVTADQQQLPMRGFVAIVTGANSGTGLAITQQLAVLGATVVMACRDSGRCEAAAQSIRNSTAALNKQAANLPLSIEPALLDLADLKSVQTFAKDFTRRYKRLDVLINNAGSVPPEGSRTKQGLEMAIGSMHVGHAALTRWLRALLLKPVLDTTLASRIVHVSSQAYMAGSFDPSIFVGTGRGDFAGQITDNCGNTWLGFLPCCPIGRCPNTNGYGRAKLATMLHSHELQRRVDAEALVKGEGKTRRLVTVSLHPGAVQTNIHPLLASPFLTHFLRSAEEASRLILHAVQGDTFVPSAYLDGMGRPHDLLDFHSRYLETHLKAHPEARRLPFIHKNSIKIPSLELNLFESNSLVSPATAAEGGGNNRTEELARLQSERDRLALRLWEVTEGLIDDFERGRSLV